MMYPNTNPHWHYELHKILEQTNIESAEKYRMMCEANVDQRGWFELYAYKLLSGIGTVLAKFGKRLQQLTGQKRHTTSRRYERPSNSKPVIRLASRFHVRRRSESQAACNHYPYQQSRPNSMRMWRRYQPM